jgi:hypothetical protein
MTKLFMERYGEHDGGIIPPHSFLLPFETPQR